MLCSVERKNGRPCAIPADRFVDGAWCCHVHDPKGTYQGNLRDHAPQRSPKRKTESWTPARRRAWLASQREARRNWEKAVTHSGRPTPVAEPPLTEEEKYRRLHASSHEQSVQVTSQVLLGLAGS